MRKAVLTKMNDRKGNKLYEMLILFQNALILYLILLLHPNYAIVGVKRNHLRHHGTTQKYRQGDKNYEKNDQRKIDD